MSIRYVRVDRVGRLKALERPRSAGSQTPGGERLGPLANEDGISRPRVRRSPQDRDQLARILGGISKTNQYGEYLAVRSWCAKPPRYLPDLHALKLLLPEAPEEIGDLDEWLFLDTETTGLSGGSGTYAFLVGIAWWEGGGLEIEQFFLREYKEERAILFALRERIAEHPVVVTFNGKTFDWPLLETRYRMSRNLQVPVVRAHLDFLHPARNLWRLRLVRYASQNLNVMYWDGTGEPTFSPA